MNKPNTKYCFIPEKDGNYNHKILVAMKKVFMEEIVNNEFGLKLPSGLGTIRIIRFVPSKTPIDRHRTKLLYNEIKKPVKYNNDHTDGYVMKVIWDKTGVVKSTVYKNTRVYKFKAYAPLNRLLLENIRKGNWKHYKKDEEVLNDNMMKIKKQALNKLKES